MNVSKSIAAPIFGLLLSVVLVGQQESVEELVAKALQNPADQGVVFHAVGALRKNPNPRVIPAFQELFSKLEEKRSRQVLALGLLRIGQKDEAYFDELAKYARAAIASTAPLAIELDKDGNPITDHLNPAFVQWCNDNQLLLEPCKRTVSSYGIDVLLLAQAKDRRAVPLLRQALAVTDPAIVNGAVMGLAWLNDVESIPLIASNLRRSPPKLAALIAAAMVDFNDPRISPVLDRFVTDPAWRKDLAESTKQRQAPLQ
jgi:HEAT repeat protein